jgi:hypothetical protein
VDGGSGVSSRGGIAFIVLLGQDRVGSVCRFVVEGLR